MRSYLRSRSGQVYFFTLVTHERRRILTTQRGRRALREAIQFVRQDHLFDVAAIVLLPDHLHAVLELPCSDDDYSTRWRLIKSKFSRLWQRRFYEHTCRDEDDLKRCIDYIRINPLKHGLVEKVHEWPWSSFHGYVKLGEYRRDWGSANEWYGDEFINAE